MDFIQPAGLDETPVFQAGTKKSAGIFGGNGNMAQAALGLISGASNVLGSALQKPPQSNMARSDAFGAPQSSYLGSEFSVSGGSGSTYGATPAAQIFSASNSADLTGTLSKYLPMILLGFFILLVLKKR